MFSESDDPLEPEQQPPCSANAQASAPPFLPSPRGPRPSPFLNPVLRILLVAGGLFLMAGFTLASQLEPAPQGYGTHQQLGLPPCSIQFFFGIPCPSCGMTTSFACYMRGEISQAWQANAAGLYLAILCTLLIPWTLLSGLSGRCFGVRRPEKWAVILLLPLTLLALLQWGLRVW